MTTLHDVARLAGVSHTTVSAVINGKNNQASTETRQKILSAIEKTGYQPSRVARQLRTGRSNIIAVCFNQEPDPHAYEGQDCNAKLNGIMQSASAGGYFVLIAPTAPQYTFDQMVKNLTSHGVDGAIVMGPVLLSKPNIDAIDSCGVPVVYIDSHTGLSSASTVDIDNAGAIRNGIEHLMSEGHRRFIFLSPPLVFQCHMDRTRAFCEVMLERRIPEQAYSLHVLSTEGIRQLVLEKMQSTSRPSAIICNTASYTDVTCDVLQELGMRIPEDVAVLSVDGTSMDRPERELLSIIEPASYAMGAAAADALMKIIAGELKPPTNIRIPAKITLRPSSTSTSR